ncbi:MAG: ribosome silencing factor [Planctomycetes bacterium]|nr:ribosome silencing factor [Planctomycetota bacterium]
MKAVEVVLLDVRALTDEVDCFVIASGRSRRQVRSMAEEVVVRLKRDDGPRRLGREGRPPRGEPTEADRSAERTWVLLDYGDVVVHLFHEEARRYYELELLWSEARRLDWTPPPAPESGKAAPRA